MKKYSALPLPNTALLSDEQCRQLRAYVDGGGSPLGTFETSLYTERNQRRADFGLADVFGIHKAGEIVGTNGNGYLPIGEQKVRMDVPPGRRVTRVELRRAEADIPFRVSGGTIEFTMPKILDYEVAALHSA